MVGTANYMAPELISKKVYDSKVDVWAAGIIAYTLLTGDAPFYGCDEKEVFKCI